MEVSSSRTSLPCHTVAVFGPHTGLSALTGHLQARFLVHIIPIIVYSTFATGEIDVLEGVHEQKTNAYTLHTSEGCKIGAEFNEKSVLSTIVNDECTSSGTDNRGCGFSDTDTQTYGKEFNLLAGGVFAHLWDSTGIRVWRFLRPSIPTDISAKKPDPSTWGAPAAFFPSTNCDIASHFFEHSLILDTSICGDLGNPTYAGSGCPGTCAQAVANNTNFKCEYTPQYYISRLLPDKTLIRMYSR